MFQLKPLAASVQCALSSLAIAVTAISVPNVVQSQEIKKEKSAGVVEAVGEVVKGVVSIPGKVVEGIFAGKDEHIPDVKP